MSRRDDEAGGSRKVWTGSVTRRQALATGAGAMAMAVAATTGTRRAAAQGACDVIPMRGPARGLNLAGAEFGQTFPGVHGRDYIYPGEADFIATLSQGFSIVRLPFRWERLQPDLDAPFDAAEWGRLESTITLASRLGLDVILDVHNYARRRLRVDGFKADHMIGSPAVPAASFAAFWAELARRTRAMRRIHYGIMNEPADIMPEAWLAIANRTIAAIRATGAGQPILAPGVSWTGAHSWFGARNTLMEGLVDPCRNLVIEVHQYLDHDSSGTTPKPVSSTIGSERIAAFQEWARARGYKAFLGEVGAGRDAANLAALADIIREVESRPDVWVGWTGWAAGPWWPEDDAYRLSPSKAGEMPPQTLLLSRFTRGAIPAYVPSPRVQMIDIDFARGRITGAGTIADVLATTRGDAAASVTASGQLKLVGANVPRIDDLGLAIERESRNLLHDEAWRAGPATVGAPAPFGAATVLDAAAPDKVWQAALPGGTGGGWLGLGGADRLTTFSVLARSDPRARAVLEIGAGDARAAYDLGTGEVRVLGMPCSADITARGEWRRLVFTFRPRGGAVAIKARVGDSVPAGAFRREVALWGAALETHGAATTFLGGARQADRVTAVGPLARTLGGRAFTVMIETHDLPAAPVGCPILAADGTLLLGRGPGGEIVSAFGGGPQGIGPSLPLSLPLPAWRGKQRVALSWSQSRQATIALTGQAPTSWAPGAAAAPKTLGTVAFGIHENAALDGRISRILALDTALSPEALAHLVA